MTLPPPPPQPPPPQPPPPIAWAMSLFAPTYTPAAASEVNLMKSRLLTRLMRPASMIPLQYHGCPCDLPHSLPDHRPFQ